MVRDVIFYRPHGAENVDFFSLSFFSLHIFDENDGYIILKVSFFKRKFFHSFDDGSNTRRQR